MEDVAGNICQALPRTSWRPLYPWVRRRRGRRRRRPGRSLRRRLGRCQFLYWIRCRTDRGVARIARSVVDPAATAWIDRAGTALATAFERESASRHVGGRVLTAFGRESASGEAAYTRATHHRPRRPRPCCPRSPRARRRRLRRRPRPGCRCHPRPRSHYPHRPPPPRSPTPTPQTLRMRSRRRRPHLPP